jgi:hypothetical protein
MLKKTGMRRPASSRATLTSAATSSSDCASFLRLLMCHLARSLRKDRLRFRCEPFVFLSYVLLRVFIHRVISEINERTRGRSERSSTRTTRSFWATRKAQVVRGLPHRFQLILSISTGAADEHGPSIRIALVDAEDSHSRLILRPM